MARCDSTTLPLRVLDYALPSVRTLPRRSAWRMAVAAIWWCARMLITGVRLSILVLGYATLGTGIVLRFALGVIAMLLMFVGGLRWSVVRSRTLRVANWVDRKTLDVVDWLRGLIRLPMRWRTKPM